MTKLRLPERLVSEFLVNRDGATAIIFVLTLPIFIGAMAMAVEIGHWRQTQADLQTTADMAAIAGARELMITNSGSDITLAAKGEAFENGFAFSDGTVKVYSPPQTGKYSGKDGVEVVVEQEKTRYFTKILKQSPVAYSARATALLVDGDPACVLTLNSTASQSLKVSGSAAVEVSGCVAHSNSTASDAFSIGGSGSMTVACATSAGGFSSPESITVTDCDGPETRPAGRQRPLFGRIGPLPASQAWRARPRSRPGSGRATCLWTLRPRSAAIAAT